MTDESLRLPNVMFRAVVNLGEKNAARLPLPSALARPDLDAEWDDESEITAVYVHFDDGQLHLEASDQGIAFHFHDADGESSERSPWNSRETEQLVAWASALTADTHALMPDLENVAEDAAGWLEEGYTLYVCETEPAHLDLLEVEIEGELLTLPWLGAGEVSHDHIEGPDHPIGLLWTPEHEAMDRMIARAWLDPATDTPVVVGEPGVDWSSVGLPEEEVLPWLEGIYLNHHVMTDPASAILRASLERMGGLS